ncbi:condensation domain-containing protein, partial [Actinoalloteichus spitiensis]|uniref:condensation domain-containing protein n=1 Tax=Actinoalloteichus spitiensis TaxID=252394 RepID=UPI001FDED546
VWTFHHLLLDGWSIYRFFSDLIATYQALTETTGENTVSVVPVGRRQYGEFLRWLTRQDQTTGRAYWREALAGFDQPTALPWDRAPDRAHRSESTARVRVPLTTAGSEAVFSFARQERVTVNAVVQAGWALVLARHAGTVDVVFGATVSGRPAEVVGSQEMVGLFINTLPVRVVCDPGVRVGEWVSGVQARQVEARQFDYVPLTGIESELPAGVGLFQSLVVFENYPVQEAGSASGVRVSGVEAVEATNYPVTVTVYARDRVEAWLSYDPELFTEDTAGRVAARFAWALSEIATNPDRTLSALLHLEFAGLPPLDETTTGKIPMWPRPGQTPEIAATEVFAGDGVLRASTRSGTVETVEIARVLAGHHTLSDAAVALRDVPDQDDRLVAYVVPSDDQVPDTGELREHVRASLPDSVVPAEFVVMASLPVTPDGELDLAALPMPTTEHRLDYLAPRTRTEEALAAVWCDVLGVDRIGVEDNFFDLGGDSIVSLRVVARLRPRIQADVSPRLLFDHPTIAELAPVLDVEAGGERAGSPGPALVPETSGDTAPLSFAQQRLWFLNEFAPDSVEYNSGIAYRLSGDLDLAALGAALSGVLIRHTALRTTFESVDGVGQQRIHAQRDVPIRLVELTGTTVVDRAAELHQLLRSEMNTPFDLATGPLLRVLLVREEEDRHVLSVTMHHIVTDGWSMGVFLRDLSALYAAAVRGERAQLPELPVRYVDWAVWQQRNASGPDWERHLDYWRNQLTGLPVLELPTDHPRPAVRTGAGAVHTFEVPAGVVSRLTSVARDGEATLFMALAAITQLVLSRHSGQDDIAVGTVVSGRDRAEVEDVVGFFVNTVVLRSRVEPGGSFAALLARVRETVLGAFAHQDVPFSRLVEELVPERDTSRTPLVQALVVLQNIPATPAEFDGLRVEPCDLPREAAQFDLSLEFRPDPSTGGLVGEFEFSTDLFEVDTIRR